MLFQFRSNVIQITMNANTNTIEVYDNTYERFLMHSLGEICRYQKTILIDGVEFNNTSYIFGCYISKSVNNDSLEFTVHVSELTSKI